MDGPIIDYVRISDSPLMWSQASIYIEFEPKNLQEFYKDYVLILQELCVCSGIWDLYYLIFLRVQFFRNSGFKQYFWFSGSKLGPKANQNCTLFVRSILVKTRKDFSNTVFALLEDYLWSKLTTDIYLNKVFHLKKSWVVKMSLKINFLVQCRPFLNIAIKAVAYLMHHLACHRWSKVQTKVTHFMEFWLKDHPKAA